MLPGDDVLQIYNSILLHFHSDDYDSFKYNFKTKIKDGAINSHKFKWIFLGLHKESTKYSDPNLFLKLYFYNLYTEHKHLYFTQPVNRTHINNLINYIENLKLFYKDLNEENFIYDLYTITDQYPDGYMMYKKKKLTFDELLVTNIRHTYLIPAASTDILNWKSFIQEVNKRTGFINLILSNTLSKTT